MASTNPPITLRYDAAGHATGDNNFALSYDARGRLATVTTGGQSYLYTHDSAGLRVRKSNGTAAGTTVFVYDQNSQLLGEYDAAGKPIREYVWLDDLPVAVFMPDPANAQNPPLVYYIHADHINTPRVVTDRQTNAVRWTWWSEPFGTTQAQGNPGNLGTFNLPLRFPGQYFDGESGIHYNVHRDYMPGSGRYAQSDPIGLVGGINTYSYVGGDPNSRTDPYGLYAPGLHRSFTLRAAALAGLSSDVAQTLAELVVQADFYPGSQDVANSYMHAMCAIGSTVAQCKMDYETYLDRELKKCDMRALGKALHALQDSYSRAHKGFQHYSGFWDLPLTHGIQDLTPSNRYERTVVPHASKEMIKKWMFDCSCRR